MFSSSLPGFFSAGREKIKALSPSANQSVPPCQWESRMCWPAPFAVVLQPWSSFPSFFTTFSCHLVVFFLFAGLHLLTYMFGETGVGCHYFLCLFIYLFSYSEMLWSSCSLPAFKNLFLKKDLFNINYVYVCMHTFVYVFGCLQSPKEGARLFGARSNRQFWATQRVCWGPCSGPLQQQCALSAESSL